MSRSAMNLLPQTHTEFSSAEYWEKFFKKRGSKAFEWYGEYVLLCGVLHKYIKAADNVLMIGCGNSQLSADLYDVGYHSITNIDISEVAIRQMTEKNSETRPDMKFIKMDMLNMTFEDASFSVVLDKGTLDAVMPDSSDEVISRVEAMFSEIERVLRMGGRYVCISLGQEHIIKKAFAHFHQLGWMVRVHQIPNEGGTDESFVLPVFAFVFTKFKKMPNFTPIVELSLVDDKLERLAGIDSLIEAILSLQQFALIRNNVNKSTNTSEQVCVELHEAGNTSPRFTLHIVDGPRQSKPHKKYAVFIVPEGRETDFLFSSDKGRRQLYNEVNFERLAVVTLNRGHVYESLDSIKSELSSKVLELSPPGLPSNVQVPFLSIGEDIGKRTVRFQSHSEFSGDFVVEDVEIEGDGCYRKLIFLQQKSVVQSEAKLVPVKKKGKMTGEMKVDLTTSCSEYQLALQAGLAFVDNFQQVIDKNLKVLIIGLGGGDLTRHIHTCFKHVSQDVVELDPAIVSVATDWFDVKEDERLKIYTEDGLAFVKRKADNGDLYHAIMVDVASSELQADWPVIPPQEFLEESFLEAALKCLEPGGIFMLNLVTRDSSFRGKIMASLNKIFGKVFVRTTKEDVNEAVICIPDTHQGECSLHANGQLTEHVNTALKYLSDCAKTQTKSKDKARELLKALSDLTLS